MTGASSGIGRSFCYILAEYGFNIILTARREGRLIEISEGLAKNFGIKSFAVCADLSEPGDTNKIIEATRNLEIGLVVSNAGIGKIGPFAENTEELIERMISINCLSSSILINHFVKEMIKKQKGAIINISSVMAKLPLSNAALYSATKSFNLAFGEALYNEMKQHNVDVLTVLPGSTSTEFDGFGNKIDGVSQRTVEQVVNTSLNALGKKPVVVDGYTNKIKVFLSKIMPTSFRLRITGQVADGLFRKAVSNNQSE